MRGKSEKKLTYLAIHITVIIQSIRPSSVLHVFVAVSQGRSGTIVLKTIVGHHFKHIITTALKERNSHAFDIGFRNVGEFRDHFPDPDVFVGPS